MNAVLLRRLTNDGNDGADCNAARQLMQLMGIGETTATAIVAMVDNASEFNCGRQFAAWIGLVPGQYSAGGKARLGRITKAGDPCLRSLLVMGARAVLNAAALLDGDDLVQPGAGLCEDGVGQLAMRVRFGITRAPVERLSPWRRVWRGLACKHRAMSDQLADAPTRGYKTLFAMLTSGFGPRCVPR